MLHRLLPHLAAAALLLATAPAVADEAPGASAPAVAAPAPAAPAELPAAPAPAAPAVTPTVAAVVSSAPPAAPVVTSAPAAAAPGLDAGYARMQKRIDELEARLRAAESKVAEATQRRTASRIVPPDSHSESW